MPEITLEKYEPLQGSPGEALWFEGEQSYIDSGYSDRQQATRPPPDLVGYVALVGGLPASITAYRYLPDGKRVIAPLSYTRPEYRQMGLWHQLRAFYRADAISRGYTHVVCINVGKPGVEAMDAAVASAGGERQARAEDFGIPSVIQTPRGPIAQTVWVIWWQRDDAPADMP